MKVLLWHERVVVRVEDGLTGLTNRKRRLTQLHLDQSLAPYQQKTATDLPRENGKENNDLVGDDPFRQDAVDGEHSQVCIAKPGQHFIVDLDATRQQRAHRFENINRKDLICPEPNVVSHVLHVKGLAGQDRMDNAIGDKDDPKVNEGRLPVAPKERYWIRKPRHESLFLLRESRIRSSCHRGKPPFFEKKLWVREKKATQQTSNAQPW